MKTRTREVLEMALCAVLACGCGAKTRHETDADAGIDATEDAADVPGDVDAPDGEDLPTDSIEDVAGDDAPLPGPEWMLEYLGRYEHQDDGPDHILGAAGLDADTLVVASATGVAVVDAAAVRAGTVTAHLGKYLIDTSRASNLDGAPAGSTYFPKFFDVAVSGTTVYAATRYDGLYVFDVSGSGSARTVTEVGTHMRPREFTESVKVLGDLMFLAHHADGIEVMDIGTDPQTPTSIATTQDHVVDAWGVAADEDGKVWVADGAGGVKLFRLTSGVLSYITGDTATTSPGTALDVAVENQWVVAAMGGKGISVYEEWTAAQRNTYPLPGVCVDVEPLGDGRFAVACRDWLHVVKIDTLGISSVMASARLHHRLEGTDVSVHLGSRVAMVGDVLFVSGWDHLDAYRLVSEGTDPDIQVSGQRAQFGAPPGNRTFTIGNAGFGTLHVSSVECAEASLTCTVDGATVPPGSSTTLRIVFDASAADVQALVRIASDDPDEPIVPLLVFAALASSVDPLEAAPDFTAATSQFATSTGTFTDGSITLSDLDTAGVAAHFAIFGSWCPACLPAVAAMVSDVDADLPVGAAFFLVDQGEPTATIRHVMEKVYLPVLVAHDTDGSIGHDLYDQPRVGLPFSRSYVVDSTSLVTAVFTAYDPAAVNQAIDDSL